MTRSTRARRALELRRQKAKADYADRSSRPRRPIRFYWDRRESKGDYLLPRREAGRRERERVSSRSPASDRQSPGDIVRWLLAVPRSRPALIRRGLLLRPGNQALPRRADTARRYSPGVVVGVRRHRLIGHQRWVCTSYVERGNLSVRMASRRFTRLTNGFSKKLANHVAAVSLCVAHFNLCRVHEALRITPAMAIGITNHIWTIGELIDVVGKIYLPAPQFPRFTVIQGGLG
jgi:hypothetical protein